MSNGAYERYRPMLAVLSTDTSMLGAIEAVAGDLGWWHPGRTWTRTYGRFNPGQPAYATLIYESRGPSQEIVTIDVFDARPPEEMAKGTIRREPSLGWLRLVRFPADPALTTLPAVLRQAGEVTVVRYRPTRRCTLRVYENGVSRFAKVFAHRDGERLHVDALDLWRAGLRGELGFAVARPGRWEAESNTLWQDQVPGVPLLAQLAGPDGLRVAERLGRAAASLPRSGVHPRAVFDAATQLERSARAVDELTRRVPHLGHQVAELLDRIIELHLTAAPRPLRPIHGAPHANQWLDDGTTLGLVDFDRLSYGDPELDVAVFLGELDFEEELHLPADCLAGAFLTGYEAVAGSLEPALLSAYRGHKRLAKALRSARALRPDGAQRAERALAQASDALLCPGGGL